MMKDDVAAEQSESSRRAEAKSGSWRGQAFRLGVAGLLAGAVLGIMTRPTLPLIGQLPVGTVLTGGASLTGFDVFLRPAAEESLRHVMLFAIFGAAAGVALAWFLGRKPAVAASGADAEAIRNSSLPGAPAGSSRGTSFCMSCGAQLPDAAVFCPSCGKRRSGPPA